MNIFEFFSKIYGGKVRTGAGAEIFDALEQELHKSRPAPQH
jgi:hypothetical protein